MKKSKRKKSPYSWPIFMIFAIMIISVVFIFWVYSELPDIFWKVILNRAGETVKVFDYEKIYNMLVDGVGAWGAVIVGIVALTESEKSRKLAEKLAARENSCNVMISNYTSLNQMENLGKLSNDIASAYEESEKYICLTFENCSNIFLKTVEICWGTSVFKSYLTLVNNMKKSYRIYLPEDLDFSQDIVCNIIFTSCNDEKTFGDFKIRQGNEERKRITYYHFYGTENNNGIELSE